MATDKKSVLLYCDIWHTVSKLNDEQAGRLFKHYLMYVNDLNPEPIDQFTDILFEPIKQNLKRDLKKWESKALKNSENAKMRWNANASERIKPDANHAVKVIDTVTVTDKVKEINNSHAWIEGICMTYKLKKDFVLRELSTFLGTQKLMATWQTRTLDDLKNHFVSTIKKIKPEAETKTTYPGKW